MMSRSELSLSSPLFHSIDPGGKLPFNSVLNGRFKGSPPGWVSFCQGHVPLNGCILAVVVEADHALIGPNLSLTPGPWFRRRDDVVSSDINDVNPSGPAMRTKPRRARLLQFRRVFYIPPF